MITPAEAPLTYTLLAINILVSLYALYVDHNFLKQSVFNVRAVMKQGQLHRILTSGFLHGSMMHLAFNMFTLYFLGPSVEYIVGTLNFAIIYFGSQIAAMGLSLFIKRRDMDYSSLGASGAVSGVVTAYCTISPFSMLYFFGIVPIPAFGVAIGYLAYSMLVMNKESKIAHEAHLGGAIGGIVLTLLLSPVLAWSL